MTVAQDQLAALLTSSERLIRRRAAEVWRWLRDHNKLADIERQLAAGNVAGAIQQIERAAELIAEASTASYNRAAAATSARVSTAAGVPFMFDQTNRATVAALARERARLVREVTTRQREAITRAIDEGIRAGANPIAVARRVRDSIGLTEAQVGQVEAYRRALEAGGVEALTRQLRDRRFDRTVRRAAREETPLTPRQIDKMVEAYRERRIIRRSEDIARTESLAAVHAGEHDTWQQARASGDIAMGDIVREWWHSGLDEARPFHLSMHKQRRGLDEPFLTGLGNSLMFPGDPKAPVVERVNCRCNVTTRFVAMARTNDRATRAR